MPYFRWKAQNLDLKYYTAALSSMQSFQDAYAWLLNNGPMDLETGVLEADDIEDAAMKLLKQGMIPVLLAQIDYQHYKKAKGVDDRLNFLRRRKKPRHGPIYRRQGWPVKLIMILGIILVILQSIIIIWLAQ